MLTEQNNKLNLGCGSDIRPGYLNVDYLAYPGVDHVMNLNTLPYIFKNDSFIEIIMQDIFEHLQDPIAVLSELHRIGQDNCILYIRVPHFSCSNSWGDITHTRAFSTTAFDNFLKSAGSTSLERTRGCKFALISTALQFPRPYSNIGFNRVWSRWSKFYEKYLHGLFPCGNIEFILRIVKGGSDMTS